MQPVTMPCHNQYHPSAAQCRGWGAGLMIALRPLHRHIHIRQLSSSQPVSFGRGLDGSTASWPTNTVVNALIRLIFRLRAGAAPLPEPPIAPAGKMHAAEGDYRDR